MESQKNQSLNPILSSTSRQFYSRRLPQRQHSNAQLDKVLKTLNTSNERKINRTIKTEAKEDVSGMDFELSNLRRLAQLKVEALVRRESKEWKELLESFENFRKSFSKQVLLKNEINFMLKMAEVIKKNKRPVENQKIKLALNRHSEDSSLETVRLYKENQILRQKLNFIEGTKAREEKSVQQSIHVEHQQQSQTTKVNAKVFVQMQSQIQMLRSLSEVLRQQKRKLEHKIGEMKTNNETLCEQIVKIRYFSSESRQKMEMWRNIMMMQNQEINTLKRDQIDLKKELQGINKKYQSILKRFSSLSNKDQVKIAEITKKHVEIFSEQVEAFQKVRSGFILKSYYNSSSKDNGNNFYVKYMGEKETLNNTEGIKKTHKDYYRYYKPSFYIYLEKYFQLQGVDNENYQQIGIPVDVTFLSTLRSILDSKFNEYLINGKNLRNFSSLGNFTISWLANFTVDKKSRERQQISSDTCFQTYGGFYLRLMSPHLNNNWEVITFRQFLLQSLTTDELLFYLKARSILLKGDAMVGKGAFMEILQVNYVDALLLIQQAIGDFDYRKKMQDFLKRTAEYQRRNHLIDSHFVLRLVLEYYIYKKKQNFASLSKAFTPYLREKNISMPFEVYLKIFDYNSFDLSLIEKGQIYQKAYSMGRGSVYLQNIFTVMNEEGFLCKQVEKMFNKHLVVKEIQSLIPETQQKDQRVEGVKHLFQKTLQPQIPKIGLQSVRNVVTRLIQEKNATAEGLFQRMQIIFDISLVEFSEEELCMVFPIWSTNLKEILRTSLQKKRSLELLEDFTKKEAAKQILHFYRRKKFLIRSFISNYEQKEKGNEKTIEIRNQFTALIQNLKNKYQEVKANSEGDLDYEDI